MRQHWTDAQVDAMIVEPVPSRTGYKVTIHRGDLPLMVSDFLYGCLSSLRYYLEGVRDRQGSSSNDNGFRYDTDELWPGDEPFSGVEIYTPVKGEEAVMSRAAFERLMMRYFRAVVTSATTHDDPIIREPWWPLLVKDIAAIEARVQRCE